MLDCIPSVFKMLEINCDKLYIAPPCRLYNSWLMVNFVSAYKCALLNKARDYFCFFFVFCVLGRKLLLSFTTMILLCR